MTFKISDNEYGRHHPSNSWAFCYARRRHHKCFARFSYQRGVYLSTCHTLELYQNSAKQKYEIFNVDFCKD